MKIKTITDDNKKLFDTKVNTFSTVKEVHLTKTSAIKRITYFQNSRSYANSFYCEKYNIQGVE